MFETEYKELKELVNEKGYEIHTIDKLKDYKDVKCVLIFNILSYSRLIDLILNLPKERLILFIWEPPTVSKANHDLRMHKYFGKIYTWEDNLIDNEKYFKFYYPSFLPFKGDENKKFEDKKLCVMINKSPRTLYNMIFANYKFMPQELYTERDKCISFFEKLNNGDFEFYGRGWWKFFYRTYRGSVKDKILCMQNYKFCICYENTKDISGYVTEKIFDAFCAGCVPVYWGANNIEQYIPKECFIDRRSFKNNEELYKFLKNVSAEEHKKYIENIKNLLNSKRTYNFTYENLNKTILEAIGLN
jgi:hypothetical protein